MRLRCFDPRRIAITLCVALIPALCVAAATDAGRFIGDRAHRVIDMFNNPRLSADQREDQLRTLVAESFDVQTISRFVLGRHWARATPAEREQFTKVFEHYMVHVYASRFSRYPDATIDLTGERQQSANRTLVHSKIDWRGASEPAKVDWHVKKVGDRFMILDVSIEGVSQVITLRDEFSTVIQQHNGQVAGLITQLREKIGE